MCGSLYYAAHCQCAALYRCSRALCGFAHAHALLTWKSFPRALRASSGSCIFTFIARNCASFSLLCSLLWSLLSSLLSSPPPFRLSPLSRLRSRLCLLFCSRLRLSLRFVPGSRPSRATSIYVFVFCINSIIYLK